MAVLSTACLVVWAQPCRAETGVNVARAWETGGTLTTLAFLGAFELDRSAWSPRSCSWCAPPGFDLEARSSLKWRDTQRATLLSNVAVVLEPVLAVGGLFLGESAPDNRERYDDLLLIAESVAVTGVLAEITKVAAARERPRVYGLSATERQNHRFESEDNLSFFSGHTSFVFAVATSAGTVAALQGDRTAPWIWGVGFCVASSAGYLRIAADAHYLSDVLSGALVGSAVGVAVPLLHRSATPLHLSIQPLVWRGTHGISISGTL